MKLSADRLFLHLLIVAAVPVAALVFALTRAAHDIQVLLANAPSPVAGFCREAVAYSLNPLAHASYVGFAGLALVSGALGLVAGVNTHMRTRRRLEVQLVSQRAIPERLRRLSVEVGLARICLLETSDSRAFTYGYLRPAVWISRGLLARLDDLELEAVLRHEKAHVVKRDPLRILIVVTITRALVFAPLTRRLYEAFQVAKEVDADRAVIRDMGSTRPLVLALIAAGEIPRAGDSTAGFSDTLSARIDWLEGNETQLSRLGTWRATTITLAAVSAVAVGLFVIVTGAVDAHVLHVCAEAGSSV